MLWVFQEASNVPTRAGIGPCRLFLGARLECLGAAGMEAASRWRVDRRGNIARQHNALSSAFGRWSDAVPSRTWLRILSLLFGARCNPRFSP